ncbi:MAG TPA: hypothetical protein VII94_02520 [Candidatus Saccharimonadales bacterium]
MNRDVQQKLATKMLTYRNVVKTLLDRIKTLEGNTQFTTEEKIPKIKKIRQELSKVGTEIDNIKNELNLISAYKIN